MSLAGDALLNWLLDGLEAATILVVAAQMAVGEDREVVAALAAAEQPLAGVNEALERWRGRAESALP